MVKRAWTIAVFVSAGSAISAAPPTFSTQQLISQINGLLPMEVRSEDIDQDGDLDVYAANYSGRIAWYENDGGLPPGPWEEHVLTEFADGALGTVAVRVDGDADIDFFSAAFNRDEIAWYDNGGDAQAWTTEPIGYTVRLPEDVWAADLDGDGDNDGIAVSGWDGQITWYENRIADGSFWVERFLSMGGGTSLEAADLDQDGDVDVVSGSAWFENDGGSPPTFKFRSAADVLGAHSSAIMDADRDGDPDVVASNQGGNLILWYQNDGALPPGWTTHVVSTTAVFAMGVHAADLDGDADMDILSASFDDDTIAWYENDGCSPPSWTERAISTAAMGACSVFAADVDDDGDKDVLSATQRDGKIVLHLSDANYSDDDRDGMRDELDCAPADGTAFVVPREVSGVRFRFGTQLEWNSAVAGSGSGARHDVMRGMLSQLPPGSGAAEACLANDAPARFLTDATVPAPGTGFYYLIRASNACGTGTFGAGSSGVPRNTGACL
ncbi:MAG: FG-GAP repeat domain-containing protein [Candidatus Polarisedimenticolia bacterium]